MSGDKILLPSLVMLMLLVLFALIAWLRDRQDLMPRGYRVLLGALIVGGLVAYAVPPFERVAATMIAVTLTSWSLLAADDLRFVLYSTWIGVLLTGLAVWRALERPGAMASTAASG